MKKTIGFIGAGNMAVAMCKGMITSKIIEKDNVIFSDVSNDRLKYIFEEFKIKTTNSNTLVASESDILILAVKPDVYSKVIKEIKNYVKKNVIIITIAAGITLEKTRELFEKDLKIIRTMPNTPAMVQEGMTTVMPNGFITENELEEVLKILKTFGKVEIIKEELIHGAISVSGSSPAYVFMMIEAMGDAGVSMGLTREQSYKFAAQSVMGAAKMILEIGKHPGELKDMVCSPSGTTIEAVKKLEENGFKNSIIKCMEACEKKSKEMSK